MPELRQSKDGQFTRVSSSDIFLAARKCSQTRLERGFMPKVHTPEELGVFARQVLEPFMGQPRALLFVQMSHHNEVLKYTMIFGNHSQDLLVRAESQLTVCYERCQMAVIHDAVAAHYGESQDPRFVLDLNALLAQRGFSEVLHLWLHDETQDQVPQQAPQNWLVRLIRALKAFLKPFLAPVLRWLAKHGQKRTPPIR